MLADSLEQRQEKKLTAFYVSRATIFYAQGMAYIQRDDTAAARVAYERALVEDLGFHMASIRLAGRALSTGDTTAALSHMAHAVAVSPTDAPLRMYYGIILSARKQSDEARDQFLKAIEINPDFAQPYLHLAQEIEGTDLGSAVASYETFLLRSAKSDSARTWVERRLEGSWNRGRPGETMTPARKKSPDRVRRDPPKPPDAPSDEPDAVEQALEDSFPGERPARVGAAASGRTGQAPRSEETLAPIVALLPCG